MNIAIPVVAAVAVVAIVATSFERPPMESVQRGYRGTAMSEVYSPRTLAALTEANAIPDALPPLGDDGPKAKEVYQNVKVLGDVSAANFGRLMVSISQWVAPQDQGCNYCHNPDNLASDERYTKVVARRMIQMVKHINSDWTTHVGATGVTCYTCHRGEPVPKNVWFNGVGPAQAASPQIPMVGKNVASTAAVLASLPTDPLTPFLEQANDIRVEGTGALPAGNMHSIKQTEWTYSLMMHMSDSLGVNCTYCHNTRQFSDWSQSTPQRQTAWYGIRMVRDLNTGYLDKLADVFPPVRHGPAGDAPKLDCATCHNGVYKPLFGVSMVQDFPELQK